MKIDAKILKEWLKKATIDSYICEGRLDFAEDGISWIESDKANQSMSKCKLKKEAFVSYEKIGEVGVSDFELLMKMLQRFHYGVKRPSCRVHISQSRKS